ncbi:hypothetical protein [Methyloceanibacter caenitepidi]|uniref:Uncharacterized protein n=1 Tax=Methyloceanibacter caenitepidi TaxID=1384459 RepID=A0A0A8K014_9HYPH|nr:hypothetical protein [Methyloceanibacter caenitepidi]BAQ16091.1 hypothetical protein GL4_0628 [Methyloceanibacter caenitepidi]
MALTLPETAQLLDELAKSPKVPEEVRQALAPKNGPSAAETLRAAVQSRGLFRDAALRLLDMAQGRWSPSGICKICLVDEEGNRKCSTFCAGLRMEYADTILKENPL